MKKLWKSLIVLKELSEPGKAALASNSSTLGRQLGLVSKTLSQKANHKTKQNCILPNRLYIEA
jgi:hypothetical protein